MRLGMAGAHVHEEIFATLSGVTFDRLFFALRSWDKIGENVRESNNGIVVAQENYKISALALLF